MPVLAIGGAASYGDHVAEAMDAVADDVQGVVIAGAGHWVAEEAPDELLAALTTFLAPYRDGRSATAGDRRAGRAGRWVIRVNRRRMPLIDGATEWLNSEPLGPSELRGRVVLVDFWTLTCINWLRTEPYIRAWAKAYRDDGLVVIGVHTPEFSFEHEVDRVRQAIDDRRIDYPVVIDNDYRDLELLRQQLLAGSLLRRLGRRHPRPSLRRRELREVGTHRPAPARRRSANWCPSMRVGIEAEADWNHLLSPETYLGYGRGQRFLSPPGAKFDESRTYELPERLAVQLLGLGRGLDHRARAGAARSRRRTHRLSFPRSRRPPRDVPIDSSADSVPGAPRR